MNNLERMPIRADFRVANRSERVHIFGYVRLLPFIMWIGGIVLLVALSSLVKAHPVIWITLTATVLIGPVLIDRSPLLDPVDHVDFGTSLFIKRLAGQQSYRYERIEHIALSAPAGEDYDDANRGRRQVDVTIRIKGAWPARLLVLHDQAARIASWAKARRIVIMGAVPEK